MTLRRIYLLLPERLRKLVRHSSVLNPLREWYRAGTSRHSQFYDAAYYNDQDGYEGPALRSAPHVAADIVQELSAKSVIDVGCGTGEYLLALSKLGVDVHGVELSQPALQRCRERGLDVIEHDLTKPGRFPWTADVVLSAEVAEHLVPGAADAFVDKLSSAAGKHIMLTAAGPRQPGNNHFNCQPKSYWVQKLQSRNFRYDEALTAKLEKRYTDLGAAVWFQRNLMIFHRI